jgi:hypothetical protein
MNEADFFAVESDDDNKVILNGKQVKQKQQSNSKYSKILKNLVNKSDIFEVNLKAHKLESSGNWEYLLTLPAPEIECLNKVKEQICLFKFNTQSPEVKPASKTTVDAKQSKQEQEAIVQCFK